MDRSEDSNRRPMMFLLGTVVIGILVVVLAAYLLRKPASTNPFDAPPASTEPAAPGK